MKNQKFLILRSVEIVFAEEKNGNYIEDEKTRIRLNVFEDDGGSYVIINGNKKYINQDTLLRD